MIPWERDDGSTDADDDATGNAWGVVFAAWVALACVAVVVWIVWA